MTTSKDSHPCSMGLRRSLNFPILTINDPDYDPARRVWNGRIDRKPSAKVRFRLNRCRLACCSIPSAVHSTYCAVIAMSPSPLLMPANGRGVGGLGDGVAPSAALETFQAAALFDCAGLEGNSAQAEVMAAASANLLWLSEVVGMR